jgi:hypothetical protein
MASQNRVCAANHWSSLDRYSFQRQRCLCEGRPLSVYARPTSPGMRAPLDTSARAPRTHSMYLAFLKYQNSEYEPERSFRDYALLPMNWLTVTLTGRDYIHCQPVFQDQGDNGEPQYYTFSVDNARPVHVYDSKSFRAGWDFVKISVTEQQELAMYNFCVAQLGLPLNATGQLTILFMSYSGGGRSWFCSELATAMLEAAGLVDYSAWPGVTCAAGAAPHNLYDYLTKHCTRCDVELMQGNPVSMMRTHQAAQSAGPISLAGGALPVSIVRHAASASSNADLVDFISALPLEREPAPRSALDSLRLLKK